MTQRVVPEAAKYGVCLAYKLLLEFQPGHRPEACAHALLQLLCYSYCGTATLLQLLCYSSVTAEQMIPALCAINHSSFSGQQQHQQHLATWQHAV